MPPICNLNRPGRTTSDTVSVSLCAISGDDLYSRMCFKPRAQCLSFSIREEINRTATLQINEQCPASLTTAESKVIASDDAWCYRLTRWRAA